MSAMEELQPSWFRALCGYTVIFGVAVALLRACE